MKPITAILIDDEKLAREMLKNMIDQHLPDLQVLAEANSVDTAIPLIQELQPEIVFLDINMPEKSGFDLVNEIQNFPFIPRIIFVTSYDKYAINAVKCAAFDYLVKPVQAEELIGSYERFIKVRSEENIQTSVDALVRHLKGDKLLFTTRTGCFFIDPTTVIYFQADGNYSHIYLTDDTKKTVTVNIGEIFSMLNANAFSRISRSVIINLKFLSELNKTEKNCILKVKDQEFALRYHPSFIQELISS